MNKLVPNPATHAGLVFLGCPYGGLDHNVRSQHAALSSAYSVQVWIEERRPVFSPLTHEQGFMVANYAWARVERHYDLVDAFHAQILAICDEVRVLKLDRWSECRNLRMAITNARKLDKKILYVEESELGGMAYRYVRPSLGTHVSPAEENQNGNGAGHEPSAVSARRNGARSA